LEKFGGMKEAFSKVISGLILVVYYSCSNG